MSITDVLSRYMEMCNNHLEGDKYDKEEDEEQLGENVVGDVTVDRGT